MKRHTIDIRIALALLLCIASTALSASVTTGEGAEVLCVSGAQNDSIVVAGAARNGIYRSTDGGRVWTVTGLREGTVQVILPDQRNAAHLYAGTSAGLLSSADGGASWYAVDTSMHAIALAASSSGSRLLIASDGALVRCTADDGKQWSVIGALSAYGIRHLSAVQTDTGALFVAACDTAVLAASEKDLTRWTKLPAITQPGSAAARITAILCDTLSREGLKLVAGTASGVFMYSFTAPGWTRLNNGLPEGRVGSLGLIVYDTTSVSRSYSLCASVSADPAVPSSRGGVYKISFISGIVNAASAWNQISGEQVDVRSCFIPGRGPNRSKIYLGTDDGMRISYDGGTSWITRRLDVYPIASVPQTVFNAGIAGYKGTARVPVRVLNRGERLLTVRPRALSDTVNFSLAAADSIAIAPGGSGEISVRFNPVFAGKSTAQLQLETNDPLRASFTVNVSGYGTGASYGTVKRMVVIDRSHGGPAIYAELAHTFSLAGMSVIDSLPQAPGSDCALILLPAPERRFTDAECTSIAAAARAGATVMALCGDGDSSRIILNALLASSVWTGGAKAGLPIEFGTARVSSARGMIAAARSFALRSAAYLSHADTFAFAQPAVEVRLTGPGADTLCAAGDVMLTEPAGTRTGMKAVLGAVARTGAGKVIAVGDERFWSSEAGGEGDAMGLTGLWGADNFSSALSIASTIENTSVSLPGKLAAEQYRLFSMPYALADNSVEAVFRSFGKIDPYEWRLFGAWNEPSQTYIEYPAAGMTTIDRGRAYWVITKVGRDVAAGTADYSLIPEPFEIRLKPGFTLIGDPFTFPIDWRSAVLPTSVESRLWSYTGTEFVPTSVMKPFEGYFINNASDSDAVIRLMPEPVLVGRNDAVSDPGSGTNSAEVVRGAAVLGRTMSANRTSAQADRALSADEWMVNASATDGTVNDGENYFGMMRSASDARDADDFSEPPAAPGRSISFRFTGADGRAQLAGDYRRVNDEGAFWNCDVRASEAGARVTVCLTPQTPLPAGYGLYVLDCAEERVVDCSGGAAYEFRLAQDEHVRTLRIIAGEQNFVIQHTDGVPLTPLTYALEQNYPNPWNPSTTIRFTLAHSQDARLEVFNLLGQKVRTLQHGALPLGTYEKEWDGKDDRGVSVSSGVYIYRLAAGAYTQSKRMVLIR